MTDGKENKIRDYRLVEQIKRNDKKAFKELYFIYYERLFRFAWNRTSSKEKAAEFVQELFVKVWIKRKNLDAEKSVQAFLFRALKNLMIDASKLHSAKNVELDEARDSASEKDIDLKIDLYNAIDNLPPKIQDVYLLSRYDGFKYSEIAEICKISVKAVEKRMAKALSVLRKKLTE